MSRRPSPRIKLILRPPLAFEAFSRLIKAIGQTMDDREIPFETSSEHEVRNEGDIATLYAPDGTALATYDMQAFRVPVANRGT